ncbi:hypothetical protein EDB87DRAFT_1637651, partial [Lactarius vividus]
MSLPTCFMLILYLGSQIRMAGLSLQVRSVGLPSCALGYCTRLTFRALVPLVRPPKTRAAGAQRSACRQTPN